MSRRFKSVNRSSTVTSKNSTLSATIQRTLVLRRECINAHQVALRASGITLVKRVLAMLPDCPPYETRSPAHQMVSNFSFFAPNSTLGDRATFIHALGRHISSDLFEMRSQLMSAPLSAWELVGAPDSGDAHKATWRLIGPADVISSSYIQIPYDETPAPTQQNILAVTDTGGHPIKSQEGEVRVGWMMGLETLQPAHAITMREQLRGSFALLFSARLSEDSVARLKRATANHRWHGPAADEVESRQFFPADYERDLLTQLLNPAHTEVGLGTFYFLPVNLRHSFPERFRLEFVRNLGSSSLYTRRINWHRDFAPAHTTRGRAAFFAGLDDLRQEIESRINRYSTESIELTELKRLYDNKTLLALMGADPKGELDLSEFGRVGSHPVELLGLGESWLKARDISKDLPIDSARRTLKSRPADIRRAFEKAVERHITRLRWVTLMKRHEHIVQNERHLVRDCDYFASVDHPGENDSNDLSQRSVDADIPAQNRPDSAAAGHPPELFELRLPDYPGLITILEEIFAPQLMDVPLRELLAPLKSKVEPMLEAIEYFRTKSSPPANHRPGKTDRTTSEEAEAPDESQQELTMADLPNSRAMLMVVPGVGHATMEKIERLILDEMLAWPRSLPRLADHQQEATTHIAEGLDDLADFFG